jgi:hypothetical protein
MVLPNIAVIYLFHESEQFHVLERFVKSYKSKDAGIKHKLLLALKGDNFSDFFLQNLLTLGTIFDDIIYLKDEGFDIYSYQLLGKFLYFKTFFFMNSHCEINSNNWLAHCFTALNKNQVALVGCTGSYQSIYSDLIQNYSMHYTNIGYKNFTINKVRTRLYRSWFPKFSNPHVRTNAFMIRRSDFLNLTFPFFKNRKISALRFESGYDSITRQILKTNHHVVVAGSDGVAYAIDCWMESRTYFFADQSNLLVSDNRTRVYDDASNEMKLCLSRKIWGLF